MKQHAPTQWQTAMQNGARCHQSGKFDAAARAFAAATRIEPNQAEGWANLGAALAQLGQIQQAMESLETSLRLNPNLAPALVLLGDVYRLTGNWNEMISAYERATELDRSPEALNKLACALRIAHKKKRPEALYIEALRKAPTFTTARVNLATLQVELERFDEALEQLHGLHAQKLPAEEQDEVETTLLALKQYLAVQPALQRALDHNEWDPLYTTLKSTPDTNLQVDEETMEGIYQYIESAMKLPPPKGITSPPQLPDEWPLVEALFMIPHIGSIDEYHRVKDELKQATNPRGKLLEAINMETVIITARTNLYELNDPVKAEMHLRHWHALASRNLPGFLPGQFKMTRNMVRSSQKRRSQPHLVTGTLRTAFEEIYRSLPPGTSRGLAAFMAIADIHPFADGNGRIGLALLNRELETTGQMPVTLPKNAGLRKKMGAAIAKVRKNKGDIALLLPIIEEAQQLARHFCKELETFGEN